MGCGDQKAIKENATKWSHQFEKNQELGYEISTKWPMDIIKNILVIHQTVKTLPLYFQDI